MRRPQWSQHPMFQPNAYVLLVLRLEDRAGIEPTEPREGALPFAYLT